MEGTMVFEGLDDSPRRIRELLDERGLSLKKRWGQNFMISRAARERIVASLEPDADDLVWEIGSGLGAITELLVERARRVVVFEVDYGLMQVIEERFGETVSIVAGDAVKTLPAADEPPDRIAGNLPYRSAAAIVSAILETPRLISGAKRLVFTVQREMALRMVAAPDTSDYSPFSVLCQLNARVKHGGDLSRGNFYPAPDVVSSIVIMDPAPLEPTMRALCAQVARALFAQRRKTISNNASSLADALGADVGTVRSIIVAAGVDLSARAESVPPGLFLEIARRLSGLGDYSGRT
ncbi:MAG TPA: 16S rRNA (adenine(1518)-N(6)/adenine(1519)-N(6))-dimethyltransferase RsmA [Spirochaetia bacterium]|nr:16S rRNA (adenine(1518)-N(6)/adenine(1519)-N(6))-dimethyltransferase RsmA [Spirochaetia bacterium]